MKAWLFDGLRQREIGEKILHLDSGYTRGFQSMSILHSLGLKKDFQGFFQNHSVLEAIQLLKETGNPDYEELIVILSRFKYALDDDDDDLNQVRESGYELHSKGNKVK